MAKPKKQTPVRFRAARSDATVGAICKTIERTFDLPAGSVHIVLPTGRKARSDGKIQSLLRKWGY